MTVLRRPTRCARGDEAWGPDRRGMGLEGGLRDQRAVAVENAGSAVLTLSCCWGLGYHGLLYCRGVVGHGPRSRRSTKAFYCSRRHPRSATALLYVDKGVLRLYRANRASTSISHRAEHWLGNDLRVR